jgi:hypothetical protein
MCIWVIFARLRASKEKASVKRPTRRWYTPLQDPISNSGDLEETIGCLTVSSDGSECEFSTGSTTPSIVITDHTEDIAEEDTLRNDIAEEDTLRNDIAEEDTLRNDIAEEDTLRNDIDYPLFKPLLN